MSQTESKDILRNIFSSSSDGIACIDLTGFILFANKSFSMMLGYSSEEIKGRNIRQIMKEGSSFNKFILNNDSDEKFYEMNFIKKSGEIDSLQIKYWRQQNGLSDATIWLIIKNIKETEMIELSPSMNGNGNQIPKITLDLQEQLKIISNCLRNLQQDLGGEIEDVDDYISFASESCFKAKDLINNLLKYAGMNYKNKELRNISRENIELSKQLN